MRLIDADKLFPDRNTEKGLAISQSQIANAETIESQRLIPCEGAIRREDAVNALKKELYNYEDKTEQQFKESKELNLEDWFQHRIFVQNMNDIDIQTILELPPVTSQTRWIPCSERLPDTTDEVLVTDGVDMMVAWYDYTLVGWASFDSNFDTDVPIKAWMPLPTPYKAESEGEEV